MTSTAWQHPAEACQGHLLEVPRVVAQHEEHVILSRVQRICAQAVRLGGGARLSGQYCLHAEPDAITGARLRGGCIRRHIQCQCTVATLRRKVVHL